MLIPFVEQQEIQQTISDEMLCESFNKLGTAHYWLNDFEKAYSAYEQGYRISLKLPEFGLVAARVTRNLGLACNYLGYREDALRYLEKAHIFFERVSDVKELANTLYDMALATGNAEYMLKACSLYEGLNLVREANLAKQYHAFHVESKRDPESALRELDSCAREFEQIGDTWMCIYTLSRAATVCIENGDLHRAGQYLEDAEGIKEREVEGNDYLSIDYYMALAAFHLRRGNYTQSVLDSQMASHLCDKMNLMEDSAKALELTAEAYELQGLHELAYQVSKKVIRRLKKKKEA